MNRRLSAILVADVAGYSRLVQTDESATLAALRGVVEDVVRPALDARHGRLVKLMGDGILAEFASVVDAVNCAVDIQSAMVARGSGAVPIQFRIGINLGDVVVEDGDVYGDGVILASRLEGLAAPGAICVSRTVADHVGTRSDVTFRPMGSKKVKNIDDPVEAFEVVAGAITPGPRARRRRPLLIAVIACLVLAAAAGWWMTRPDFAPVDPADMAMPLPAGPSIAVLPFAYLGADKAGNDFIADGLTANVISALARIPGTVVIAGNSVAAYKDRTVDVRDVAQAFGVRYVLDGSVQKSGDSIRVTARLVDGVAGRNLWSDVYDRAVDDVFAVQDEIALRVARAIYRKTFTGSDLRQFKGTSNLEAWASYIEGAQLLAIALPEQILRSIPFLERAVELDPAYATAHAALAHTEFFKARWFLTDDPAAALEKAVRLAQNALTLDPQEVSGYSALGMARLIQRRPAEAADAVIKGADIAPGDAFALTSAAWVLTYVGRAQEALPYFDRAIRTYVVPPWWLFGTQSQALSDLGRHAESLAAYETMMRHAPERPGLTWQPGLADRYMALGDEVKAREAVARARAVDPALSIRGIMIWDSPYVDQSLPNARYDRLRQLGVPDTPPGAD